MKMQSAVEEYLVEIEVRKYTPKTIRSYRCNLNLFLRFCAEKLHVETVEELTPAVVRQFSRCMSEAGRKGTYINGVLKSIKSFIQYCYEEGYGGFDTRKSFKWCKEEKPVITAFSPEQVRIMLQSCRGHDYLSLRDYAILTLLFETGIRCWELCCIREEDILIISCRFIANDDILLVIAQTVFSAVVIEDAIRLIIFTQRIKTLYEEGYHELITVGISTTAQRVWLKFFCVEYESIKAHYRIRLSESLFNKLNPQLSETWEKLSSQIKISTGG